MDYTEQDMYTAALELVKAKLAEPYEAAIALAIMQAESGFTSYQFRKCGTAGMVARMDAPAPYYGWSKRHFLRPPSGVLRVKNQSAGTNYPYLVVPDAQTGLFAIISRLRDMDKLHQWNSEPGNEKRYSDTVENIFMKKVWPRISSSLNLQ